MIKPESLSWLYAPLDFKPKPWAQSAQFPPIQKHWSLPGYLIIDRYSDIHNMYVKVWKQGSKEELAKLRGNYKMIAKKMNPIEEEKLNEDTNIIPFSVVFGGKEPPDGDWLSDKPIGTVLLIKERNKPNQMYYLEISIFNKIDGAIGIIFEVVEDGAYRGTKRWVNPKEFTKAFSLVDILRTPPEEPKED